jgi:23S rRNA (guanine2445-N2)-methyltransferase / 23S rRNA (guanine2069-N7)-methyltransferase
MSESLSLFVTTPHGLEKPLADELRQLGAESVRPGRAGVTCRGDLAIAYRTCLWSRLANRVLMPLAEFPAPSPEALYHGVQLIDWSKHLDVDGTLAITFFADRSKITHSQYGAQRVKDAIVDQFRERTGRRPSVDRERPDLRVNVYLHRDRARMSIDLSGESLHRRGYRSEAGAAPLKENLAAGLLALAGWPQIAQQGGALVDPLCGSGTLAIEGALMAADIAPGLLRNHFGFVGWLGHDRALWAELRAEAVQRREAGLAKLPPIIASDLDQRVLNIARDNASRAGLGAHIQFSRRDCMDVRPLGAQPGLFISNPPYGERLDAEPGVARLYGNLGRLLRQHFTGWRAAIFTGNTPLLHRVKLTPEQNFPLRNGAIDCRLACYRVATRRVGDEPLEAVADGAPAADDSVEPAQDFANRLKKNLRTLGKWAKREGIDCFRLYDADLPEYAFAVDLYRGEDGKLRVHVQEYAPPRTVDPARAETRRRSALAALPEALDVPADVVFFKERRRQRGEEQYERQGELGEFFVVREGAAKLWVNLADYLDTGLFLDHRPARAWLAERAPGNRVLNLFAYTGSASVLAAVGGAVSTTTVDMSATYLDWARRNFELNGLSAGPDAERHRCVQADCLRWLADAARAPQPHRPQFDLIFLDPPTFSNSKRMDDSWDVQRDHAALIGQTMALLARGGTLLFSCNLRRFRLDPSLSDRFAVEDVSATSIPRDFARNQRIHQCFHVRHRQVGERG